MANPRGDVFLTANGKKYHLWLGMSVLSEVQDTHGQDALEQLEPPEGAPESWMPPMAIVMDLFLGALQRYHAAEADRWLVDDIIAQNDDAFTSLMDGSGPEGEHPAAGKPKAPARHRR